MNVVSLANDVVFFGWEGRHSGDRRNACILAEPCLSDESLLRSGGA
jgi:hypothetical protein